jgi:DNA-binding NarL/FixJ family response regulator
VPNPTRSREQEILELLARGERNNAIADYLGLSAKTISNYISNILNKLQVADRAQAIAKAREEGLGRGSE